MGLSRSQLWQAIENSAPVIPSLLNAAYEHELYWDWKEGDRAPHGMPWHSSFHASAFPGDDPVACGRKAVYELLDLPADGPLKPRVKAMFDQGLDLEHHWVSRLNMYGTLLSADVTADDDFQTGFEDEEHWLTGSCDAIILPRGWTKPYIGEFKTTSHEKVLAMLSDTPTYVSSHEKYLRQLKTYIGMAHELPFVPTINLCDESGAIISSKTDYVCPQHRKRCVHHAETLLPPDSGELVYSSREEPLLTAAFKVDYDPQFMAAGRARLAEWRDYFLRGEIPPHPREAKEHRLSGKLGWSIQPCLYCPLKKFVCRPDHAAGVTRLKESSLVEFAKSVRPDWSYEEKRAATLFRWQPVAEEEPVSAFG